MHAMSGVGDRGVSLGHPTNLIFQSKQRQVPIMGLQPEQSLSIHIFV